MNRIIDVTEEKAAGQGMTVVDVRFKTSKKVYTFEAGDIAIEPGMIVVGELEMGIFLGHVIGPRYVINDTGQPLRKIVRIATEEDIQTDAENRAFEKEAKAFCIERVKARNLPMKITSAETTLDRKRLIFYFTADGRIDFRELVRDLAARFKMRIEMRQIGVRDEVRMIGGIGACGRETCCSSFLTSFEPVSIKMAREQELTLNQNKLSGICGRLMCCIGYEYGDAVPGDISKECLECRYEEREFQETNAEDKDAIIIEDLARPLEEELPEEQEQTIKESQKTEYKGIEEEKQPEVKREKEKQQFNKRKRFFKKRHKT